MKIGELAKRSGLAPSAIRFYEAKGLLKSVARRSNGYREYPADAAALLAIIVNARQTGCQGDGQQRAARAEQSGLTAHWPTGGPVPK